MSTLVIVESPSKAKTIEKYLGPGYTVRASVGHIRDLPKSNKDAIDIEAGFVPKYVVSEDKGHVIADLKKLAKKATEIILATDPDREGEAIAWHLAEVLGITTPKRAAFNEITKDTVIAAIAHPRVIDMQLKEAQEARRVLDRLVGYDLSGIIWKKVRYGLSAGRVQSPALRIVMEREREIRGFKPVDYWVLEADFTATKYGESKSKGSGQTTIHATCVEELDAEKKASDVVTRARKAQWHIESVEAKEQKRSPRAPFTTSTLQQTASTRLGFAPSRTMRAAQKLYEAGAITYMRTDSPTISKTALPSILACIEKEYGKEYAQPRVFTAKAKNAQEAHEAVRPTDIYKLSLGKTDDERRVYELIRTRTLASQMADARVMRTAVTFSAHDTAVPDFRANGSRILFLGWLQEDTGSRGEENELPAVEEKAAATLADITNEHKQTQPPSRYTEAGLIKELEERGIGRPSTYASIMGTLVDRGYVNREGRTLIPTDTGDVVSSFLEAHFPEYISDTYTAEMEKELDDIAEGTRAYTKTMRELYAPLHAAVKEKDKKLEKQTGMGDAPAEFSCPICASLMEYKLARSGKFMSCKRFPDCAGARKQDGTVQEPPKALDRECPKCKTSKTSRPLQIRESKNGTFIGCSGYPKCKYIEVDPASIVSSGVHCPQCKVGEVIERRGRFGFFWSCNNYPACKYAIKAKPTGALCPTCGALMMEGTKTIPTRCSLKTCPMHNPHKV